MRPLGFPAVRQSLRPGSRGLANIRRLLVICENWRTLPPRLLHPLDPPFRDLHDLRLIAQMALHRRTDIRGPATIQMAGGSERHRAVLALVHLEGGKGAESFDLGAHYLIKAIRCFQRDILLARR